MKKNMMTTMMVMVTLKMTTKVYCVMYLWNIFCAKCSFVVVATKNKESFLYMGNVLYRADAYA